MVKFEYGVYIRSYIVLMMDFLTVTIVSWLYKRTSLFSEAKGKLIRFNSQII